MKVVGKDKLVEFARSHGDVSKSIQAWLAEAENAQWTTPLDIGRCYPKARFLKENAVVFNLLGNRYRLVVRVSYQQGTVLVTKIGTHAQYDKWDLRG